MENALDIIKRDIFKGIIAFIFLKEFATIFLNF